MVATQPKKEKNTKEKGPKKELLIFLALYH